MKKHILTFLAFSLALCCTAAEPRNEISTSSALATIGQGKIAGYTENGINIYKGIPYAKAERFMAPQAPDRWEGTRSCRNYGPTCPQAVRQGWQNDEIAFAFNWDDGYPGEDCLRANVWTPAKSADGGKRPVMVWLHGGGFSAGSGQELPGYDGANLARKGDVVVVTVNHRLNVLGFLDLSDFGPEYAQSGNAGLLDLVAALQWVKDNAEAFGGDVTQDCSIIPDIYRTFKVALQELNNMAEEAAQLVMNVGNKNTFLTNILKNMAKPEQKSGSLPLDNGNFYVGYDKIPTPNELLGSLNTSKNQIGRAHV